MNTENVDICAYIIVANTVTDTNNNMTIYRAQ